MAHRSSSSHITATKSFMTADKSGDEESTAATTPLLQDPTPYLNARELPHDLKAHTQIYFEEQLFPTATHLLQSIAGSGNRREQLQTPAKPLPVPPTTQLALLNTLLVHPQYTTRAERPENIDVPPQALNYLRTVLERVGPVNAGFRAAFQFQAAPRFNRRGAPATNVNDSDSDEEMSLDDDRIRGRIANEGGIWSRGQDFWSTIGWAFNVSARYPRRWQYWKVWLDFMVDVLEADWKERERLDNEVYEANGAKGERPRTFRNESIILMYMDQQDGRTRGMAGIIKALFADGSDLYSTAFREVFDKELRGPRKQNSKKRKRDEFVLDLENDKFGDYFDDESMSSGVSEPPTPQKPRNRRRDDLVAGCEPGYIESIDIRLRLFKLLSAAIYSLRKPSDLIDLYERYTSAVKLLPLEIFALYVARNGKKESPLIQETRVTVTKELFDLLLPSSHKRPHKVDPDSDADGALTARMLEHCYLPHAANTVAVEDNAKLSLVVESAIQLLMSCELLEYDPGLVAAAEKGIKARETKSKSKRAGKMKADAGDELAHDILITSGKRIGFLLELLDSDEEEE